MRQLDALHGASALFVFLFVSILEFHVPSNLPEKSQQDSVVQTSSVIDTCALSLKPIPIVKVRHNEFISNLETYDSHTSINRS